MKSSIVKMLVLSLAVSIPVFAEQLTIAQTTTITSTGEQTETLIPEKTDSDKEKSAVTFKNPKTDTSGYTVVPFGGYLFPMAIGQTKVMHHVSIHLLGSSAARIDGLSAGAGVAIIDETLNGAAFSGIGTIAHGDSQSVTGSGIFNIFGSSFKGAQGAGVFNINNGAMYGAQGAGVFNINGDTMDGVQGSGAFNINGKGSRGVSGAGVFNISDGNVYGVQGAGVFNMTGNELEGLQASGVFNYARSFSGMQASVVNVAKTANGLQAGIVNVSVQGDGPKIGLINFAKEHEGFFLGLITIIVKGSTDFEMTGDDTGFIRAGVTHGNTHFYNSFTAGVNYKGDMATAGFTWGARLPINRLILGADISEYSYYYNGMSWSDTMQHAQLRAYVGFQLFDHLAVIGGVTGNYLYTPDTNSNAPSSMLGYSLPLSTDRHHFWPGAYIGVRM